MKLKMKSIVLAICLNLGALHATVSDYQEIYQEEQKEFNEQMRVEIKKSVHRL
jgi:hypothetical protein